MLSLGRWAAHRSVRVGLWGLGVALGLFLVSWLALPPLARHLAEKLGSEQLGRSVHIGALDFKPWSLELTLRDLAIAGQPGQPALLTVARVHVDAAVQSLWTLAPVIDAIDIDAPAVRLTHLGGGRYDIDDLVQRLASAPAAPASEPTLFALYNLTLQNGSVTFEDRADGSTHRVSGLHLGLPFLSNLPAQREVKVLPRLDFQLDGAPFTSRAESTPFADSRKTDATLRLQGLDLGPYLGRLPAELPVRLRAGLLSADLTLAFEQTPQPQVRLSGSVQAEKVRVADPHGGALLDFAALRVALDDVRPLQRVVRLGRVELVEPQATLVRSKDGRWAFEPAPAGTARSTATPHVTAQATASAATRSPAQAAASAPASAASATAQPAPELAWQVAVAEFSLQGGRVRYTDAGPSQPVALELTGLQAGLQHLVLGGAGAATPLPLTLSARIPAGDADPGRIDWRGTLTLQPLAVAGELAAERVPVHLLSPYVAARLPVDLRRADAAFKGQLQFAATAQGPRLQLQGQAALDDLRADGLGSAPEATRREPLLNWKTLALRGLAVTLEPQRPLRVAVQDTLLSDFFARVIVTPQGRINLQDLAGPGPASAAAGPGAASPPAGAPAPAAATAPVAGTAPARVADAPQIDIGPIRLAKGRVLFSDRFIKPNYTTSLTELSGRLSAFSSRPPAAGAAPALADLELRGKAEGTASLEVTGRLNPLAQPLVLDITGKVRNLELAPLSPYAVKYAGYGIERGKLSMDVRYQIADGQLGASNNLVLNQLAFGDKVDGAPQSLPVKLAVALLADRNGVIDLDLPISGSLTDPQFSFGAVIGKAVLNLLTRAITAPFSLLAKAFSGGDGGDDLALVTFAPGSAALTAESRAALDKVAKALKERPALRLTAVGASSLAPEREGLRRERLQRMVLAEKRRATKPAEGQEVPPVTPAEYPELLKAVYKKAELPNKPRNLIGFAKDIPVPEMEALLLASLAVTEEDMRRLSVQRATAVRDQLAAGEVPLERLFIGAPKVIDGPEPGAAGWTPRAELSLVMP